MRPSSTSLPLLLLSAALALAPIAMLCGGCQHADPLPTWKAENVETLEMRPEWQRFVDDNYRGEVIAHLNASRGAKFEEPPHVVVTRNKSRSATEMLAAGEVDVPNAVGKVYRRPYTIVWRQSGRAWQPYDVRIDAGVEHNPSPVVPPKSVTTTKAT